MNAQLREYFSSIGKRGGQSGKGKSKRRSAAHYRALTLARLAALKARNGKKSKIDSGQANCRKK